MHQHRFFRAALRFVAAIAFVGLAASTLLAQENRSSDVRETSRYVTESDIVYQADAPEDCRLDVYHPIQPGYATVVWFHGGGLTSGKREVPKPLRENKIAVVAVDYRLHPNVTSPTYVQDAAAAVAWTFKNIAKYGGDPKKIFVSGHSAGGYLTSMIGLDKHYLAAHGIDADEIAGLIPYSGHTVTHFTVRKELGIRDTQPLVDEMAPLYHVRGDAPPTLLITGDRELEMLGRYEENAYHWRMMKVAGHPSVSLVELGGFNHGQMATPAHALLLQFVDQISKQQP